MQRNRGGCLEEGTHTLTYELTGLEGIGSGQGALQEQGKVGVQGGRISGSTDLAAGYGSVSMGWRGATFTLKSVGTVAGV